MLATSNGSQPSSTICDILRTKYAIFTGGHDKEFRSLIIFPNVGADVLADSSFSLLMKYFSELPSVHSSVRKFVILIDRRSSDWNSVQSVVNKLQAFVHDNLDRIYILKPQGFLQRVFITGTMKALRERSAVPIEFFDHVSDLLHYIDPDHLPTDFGGNLIFNLDDWITDQVSIENFQAKVDNLCALGYSLIAELQTSQCSPSSEDTCFSEDIFRLNPCYAPSVENDFNEKRRQFVTVTGVVESDGLKLRELLRNARNTAHPETSAQSANVWSQTDLTFDLPVDRVFQVITLEHILARLMEIRCKFATHWNYYAQSVHLVHLIQDLGNRFIDLQSLVSIWENLVETAADYDPNRSGRPVKCLASSFDSDSQTNVENSSEENDGTFDSLEDIEAALGRLREAEQLGNQLKPELQSLFQSASQLVNLSHKTENECQRISLKHGLDVFTAVDVNLTGKMEPGLPESDSYLDASYVVLPARCDQWPRLFGRLLELADTTLPKTVDRLGRIHELLKEISNARAWLKQGSQLLNVLTPVDETIKNLPLDDCHKRLDQLTAFVSSREETFKILLDPKQFRHRFAGVVSSRLRLTLRDLLKEVEDVQNSCDSLIASIRQHISRSNFPRHNHLPSPGSPPEPDLSSTEEINKRKSDAPAAPKDVAESPNASFLQSPSHESTENVCAAVKKYKLAWDEFVETERSYVKFLQHVYDVVWLPACTPVSASVEGNESDPIPPAIRENPGLLLGNLPELLYFHRDRLLPALESCNGDASQLKQWTTHMLPGLIDIYSVYCSIHPSAVHVAVQYERDKVTSAWMSTCSEEVARRELCSTDVVRSVLQLSSRLVTPVQRFQRYHLLVGQLLRLALTETDRLHLTGAHKIMMEMCETVNLAMRLRCLSLRPSDLGPLLLRGDFTISREDTRSTQQRHVFLFKNAILLTKFRPSGYSVSLPRSPSFNPALCIADDSRERNGSNSSLSNVPLTTNLANLVRSHVLLGGSASGGISNLPDSGPVYEIREELLLARIGLTPSLKSDRRRFAIWTANRSQTYVFHASDQNARDQWVKTINDLLLDQLLRLREEAIERQNSQRRRGKPPTLIYIEQSDRSNSLPVSNRTEFSGAGNRNDGSILSLPEAACDDRDQTS